VEAAKQFSGITLNMTYEAGLQALDPRNFSGPMWEQLTGMKSSVVELSNPDQYSKAVAEHIAGSGAYDVLDISPAWTPSLADGGVIAPLDDYIAKYMNIADLEDVHPLTRRCRPTRARSGASSTTATSLRCITARTSLKTRR
jgi:multiple sugar transport system substrate-binding protein